MAMLVLSGEKAGGSFLIEQAKLVASDVRGQVVTGAGHWLMEEAPDTVIHVIGLTGWPFERSPAWAPTSRDRRPCERRRIMVLGMSEGTFTAVHVVLSLVGIASGITVLIGMFGAKRLPRWTALFLVTTVLTSVTGFFFPRDHLMPSHIVGIISLVVLTIAILALYRYRLARAWRWIYVICAVLALYLNVFVGVVQAFQKLPLLARLAPTRSEPPFLVAQLLLLAIFVVLGISAAIKYRPTASAAA